MPKDRVPLHRGRLVQRARLPRGVCGHTHGREEAVRLGVERFEEGRDVEAVDEERAAARAVRVGEQVEELQAAGIGL